MPGSLTLRRIVTPTFALSILWACGDAGSSSSWAGTITDSAGVQVVHNPEDGLWSAADTWSVEQVLSIGSMDAADTYQFGQIVAVDVDEDGNTYVADGQSQNVRVYDPSGSWLRTLGAPGSGPGELSGSMLGVAVTSDGVRVADLGNQRYTRFGPDGTPAGSTRIDFTRGIPFRLDRIADGHTVAQFRRFSFGQEAQEPQGDALVRLNPDGEVTDTITVLPVGMSVRMQGGQARIRIFDPEPAWDAADDGHLVMGMNNELRLEILTPDGTLERVVTRPWTSKPVTERDKQVFKDAMLKAAQNLGQASPEAVQAYLSQVQFADQYPVFGSLIIGPRGSIWVQRVRSGDDLVGAEGQFSAQDLGSTDWDVYDGEGRYLGVVSFPERYQPLRFVGDRFYGVGRDELDVQSLDVYRIVMP